MGLLQESLCTRAGPPPDLRILLAEAARVPPLAAVVDPDNPVFLPPGDMPARIAASAPAALGNILVQARSLGAAPADLGGMRVLLRDTQRVRRFHPAGDGPAWQAAAGRIEIQRAL
jgi:hypothetical protein